jgi:hypothetical protein
MEVYLSSFQSLCVILEAQRKGLLTLVVKKMLARASCWPNFAAHQARETPQPSQVPQLEEALMVVVVAAVVRGEFRMSDNKNDTVRSLKSILAIKGTVIPRLEILRSGEQGWSCLFSSVKRKKRE